MGRDWHRLFGWPQLQIHRPDLQQILFQCVNDLPNVSVQFGVPVTSVDHQIGTVLTEGGEHIEADVTHHYRAVNPRSRMLADPFTAPLMESSKSKMCGAHCLRASVPDRFQGTVQSGH